MAGNIAGMFSQINRAMGQNPLGGEMGGNLMNQLSQQVGGAIVLLLVGTQWSSRAQKLRSWKHKSR